jgi:RNA polymerase sigma-70 factor, ECF subfamily
VLGTAVMTHDFRLQLVEFLPRLRRFAQALTGDRDKGDDLVQETCARALARAAQWEPGTRLDSWMFRIAQNIWLDQRRAHKVRGDAAAIDEAYDLAGEDGRAVTESRLTLAEVQAGIAELPADQQVIIALICVDGLSYKEAADVLDVPIGTVMSRLARARRALFGKTSTDRNAMQPVKESRRGRVNR